MTPEQLRKLLDAYYDGMTSSGEENDLKEYFARTPDIPEEFRVEAAMFRAITDEIISGIPAGLEERILDATVKRRHRMSPLRYLRYAGMAASLVLMFALGWWLMRGEKVYESAHENVETMIAGRVSVPDSTMTVPAVAAPSADSAPYSVPKVSEPKSNYAEVTDPDEAARIVEEVFAMLTEQMASAATGVRTVEMAIAMTQNPADILEIQSEYQ